MNYMFEISEKIYYRNYDYNYLLKSLEKAKSKDIETIVVGSSYPSAGIDVNLLDTKSINLALFSQDLYYSNKLSRLVINNNCNIKRCIIGMGYYIFNHDLSKSRDKFSINRIKNVYYPILKDKHNSENIEDVEILNIKTVLNDNVIDHIFNLEFLDVYFKDLIYRDNNGYFNLNFTRQRTSMLDGVELVNIRDEERYTLGEYRANQHNRLFKYTKTKYENYDIFNEYLSLLEEKNVESIIVIFPSTKYYSKLFNKNCEEEFYSKIKKLKERYKIKIIDFSKEDIFVEDDFIDFDHMSELGAIKITKELNKLL